MISKYFFVLTSNKGKIFLFCLMAALLYSCNLTKAFLASAEKKYDKMGQTTYSIELDSATVHWRKVGTGDKKLVLVQGFGPAPLVQWKKLVKRLHDDYTIFVPDLVYFGRSTSQYELYSPKFQARQIYYSIKKLGVEKSYVAGLSYGGLVAELFAHEHPEMTEGLILIDALSPFYKRNYGDSIANAYYAANMKEFLIPNNGKEMKKLFQASYHKPFWVPGIFLNQPVEYLYTDPKKHWYNLIDYMYDHKEEIAGWDISYAGPVQIIWGSNDIIIPVDNAYRLEEFYPSASLTVIRGAGHVPNFEEDKALAQVIAGFIEETSALASQKTTHAF